MNKIRLTVLAGAILGSFAFAEDAKPSTDQAIELSPFVVAGSVDRGYLATNTLAGTCLNTEASPEDPRSFILDVKQLKRENQS